MIRYLERLAFPRTGGDNLEFPSTFRCGFSPPAPPPDGYYTGSCTNISEGGLAFETAAVLDVSSRIEIEFRQSGQPVFRRPVRLLYRMGRQYGAYFTDSSSCKL